MATSWMNSGMGNTKGWLAGKDPPKPNPGGQQLGANSWYNSGTYYTWSPQGGLHGRSGPAPAQQQAGDPWADFMAKFNQKSGYAPGAAPADVAVNPVYSAGDQQRQYNQTMANASQAADMQELMKQYIAPGRSLGAGQASAALPQSVDALMKGFGMAQSDLLNQRYSNAEQSLAAQQANVQNALAYGGLQSDYDALNRLQNRFNQQQLMALLGIG